MSAGRTFLGYRRANGQVGCRNHVIVLPVDDISNAACEATANNIKGTMALPHSYGRLQYGEDLALHERVGDRRVAADEHGERRRMARSLRRGGRHAARATRLRDCSSAWLSRL